MKRFTLSLICCVAVVLFVGCDVTPEKLQEETARVAPHVEKVSTAIADQDLKGDDDFLKFVALLQAGNAASAPFNPYAVPVGAGLALVTAVMGAFAKKKNDEAKKYSAKYNAHKEGVELTMKQMKGSTEPSYMREAGTFDQALYENIGKARAKNGV